MALPTVTSTLRSSERRASAASMQRVASTAAQAKSEAVSSGMKPAALTPTITIRIVAATPALSCAGGALSSTSLTKMKLGSTRPVRAKPAPSTKSTSPASSTMSPTLALTRCPCRCTAMMAASYSVRKRLSRIVLPAIGAFIATTASTQPRLPESFLS